MADSNQLAETMPQPQARSGLAARGLYEVFVKPKAFFSEIREQPRVLVPYLVSILLAAIAIFLLRDLIVDLQLEAAREAGRIPEGATPPRGIMMITTVGGYMLLMVLLPLMTAGLAMLAGNFFMGGRARYKQLLSLALYGHYVFLLLGFVTLPFAVMKGDISITASLAALVQDRGLQDPLFVLLSKFSLSHIWEFMVVGIGAGAIYQFKGNKGYIVAVLSVGVLAALNVLFAVIGS